MSHGLDTAFFSLFFNAQFSFHEQFYTLVFEQAPGRPHFLVSAASLWAAGARRRCYPTGRCPDRPSVIYVSFEV